MSNQKISATLSTITRENKSITVAAAVALLNFVAMVWLISQGREYVLNIVAIGLLLSWITYKLREIAIFLKHDQENWYLAVDCMTHRSWGDLFWMRVVFVVLWGRRVAKCAKSLDVHSPRVYYCYKAWSTNRCKMIQNRLKWGDKVYEIRRIL